jgi:hypothetical protein
MREEIRYPPELWLNGKRLRGALSDFQVREELDRQRARAQRALMAGTPLTQLYEQLVAQEAAQRTEEQVAAVRRMFSAPPPVPRLLSTSAPVHLSLSGAPSRGPRIAPVTVVLIGSIDSHESYEVAKAAYEVWSRHADSSRLVYLQAPRGESRERNAVQLAQLALHNEEQFWRVFSRMLELMPRVWAFDRYRLETLIRQEAGAAALESGPNAPEARRRVTQDLEQVRRIGIENSPMVLVNGLPVRGAPLSERIESALLREQQRGLLQRLHAPPARVDYGWLER